MVYHLMTGVTLILLVFSSYKLMAAAALSLHSRKKERKKRIKWKHQQHSMPFIRKGKAFQKVSAYVPLVFTVSYAFSSCKGVWESDLLAWG